MVACIEHSMEVAAAAASMVERATAGRKAESAKREEQIGGRTLSYSCLLSASTCTIHKYGKKKGQ